MIRFVMILALLSLRGNVAAQVQPQDSIGYIHGLPVTGQDTLEQQQVNRDRPPAENLMLTPHDQLPRRLKRALERHEQYAGWERSRIYHDKNTGLYLLRIVADSTVTTYGLNDRGQTVTFDESTRGYDR